MDYTKDDLDLELVDLGCATIETKGPPAPDFDSLGGITPVGGISND